MGALPRGRPAAHIASPPVTRGARRGASAGSPPSRSGPRDHRRRSTPPRWTASPCAPPTPGAPARPPRCCSHPDAFAVVDTGDPLPEGYDAVVMREHVHYVDGQAELRAAVAPYQHVRSIGEDISATELLLPAGHRLRAGRRRRGRRRRRHRDRGAPRARSSRSCPPATRCAPPAQSSPPASCWTPTR